MKFKKISIIACIFLVLILTLNCASASDNSSNPNIQITNKDTTNLLESNNEVNFESDSIQQNSKIKSSNKIDDDALKKIDSNENQIKSSSQDSLKVEVPDTVEIWGYGDYIPINITLPKNSKGNLSIYKDNIHIKTFDLSDKQLTSRCYDICTIFKEENKKNDVYNIWYRLNNTEIGIRNFTFKYNNNGNIIEKSGLVNITYILRLPSNKILYTDNVLVIDTPPDLKGTISVEIDGKKYKTYSKIYKRRWLINYDTKCLTNKCLIPDVKNQYVKISPKLSIGKHKIKITYYGDETYPSRSVEYTLRVIAKIDADEFELGDSKKVSLELPKNAKGKLVLKFYDSKKKLVKTFTQKLKKGKAKIVIPKKFYGVFSKVIAEYNGTDYKVKREVMKHITINPPIKIPRSMLQGEKKYISINLPGKKGVLKLYIYKYKKNGDFVLKEYSRRLIKGKAKISLSKFTDETEISHTEFTETLKNGKKVTYTEYETPMIYKPFYITYTQNRSKTKIIIQSRTKGGKLLKNKYIHVKVHNKFSKKVKTNKEGVAELKIPKKYKAKTYKITVKYKKNSATETVKIKKLKLEICNTIK